ncbi:unnamed protein product [Urochloa humidicola]
MEEGTAPTEQRGPFFGDIHAPRRRTLPRAVPPLLQQHPRPEDAPPPPPPPPPQGGGGQPEQERGRPSSPQIQSLEGHRI